MTPPPRQTWFINCSLRHRVIVIVMLTIAALLPVAAITVAVRIAAVYGPEAIKPPGRLAL